MGLLIPAGALPHAKSPDVGNKSILIDLTIANIHAVLHLRDGHPDRSAHRDDSAAPSASIGNRNTTTTRARTVKRLIRRAINLCPLRSSCLVALGPRAPHP